MPEDTAVTVPEWPKSSTHVKNWLFDSFEALKSVQRATYERAAEAVKGRHPNARIPPFEDELWLIRYYSYQLSRFLNNNNLKATVKETSLALFNRFYLRRSLMEYDPRIIMYPRHNFRFTCITLATKLEDVWRSVYVDKLLGSLEDLDISSNSR